jgi:uncharacterized membrane protein YvbJ
MAAKFCSECGAAIPAGAKFCPGCGHKLAAVGPGSTRRVGTRSTRRKPAAGK